MTDKRKIEVLKLVQEDRDNNRISDFESMEKIGYNSGFLKGMINEGLVGWGGSNFYITPEGDKILRDYLIIESQKSKIKTKIIFDSNVYNEIANGNLNINLLEKNKDKYEFYITHIQIDEMNKCLDIEKRAKLFLFKSKLTPIVIPTESFILGTSRLGEARLGDSNILEKLRKGNLKNTNDALIGEVAIKNCITLITNDKNLKQNVNSNKGNAIDLDKFKASL